MLDLKQLQYEVVKKINSEVSIIAIDGKKYIYKTIPINDRKKLFELILDVFSMSFKTELAVNIAIKTTPFQTHVPSLISSDYKSYMIFEYLNARDGLTKKINLTHLLTIYLMFHSDFKLQKSVRFSFLKYLYTINLSYIRASLFYIHDRKLFVQLLKAFIICNIKQKKIKKTLIHKDLKNYQNIMHNDETIFFIDFANVNIESKWIMTDIVEMAFNIESQSLNSVLILKYINLIDNKKINQFYQIRFVLIRKYLYIIDNLKKPIDKTNKHRNFLNNVLLNETRYKIFLTEQFTS